MQDGVLFKHKENNLMSFSKKLDGTGNHHVMQDKPDVEDSTIPFLSRAESMFFNTRHEKQSICEKEEGQWDEEGRDKGEQLRRIESMHTIWIINMS